MKRPYQGYLLLAIVALAPVGLRVLTWPGPRQQAVDAGMAQAGQTLFLHEWTPHDPLSQGGDGLGPVFNARSCVACHHQGGAGGSGGLEHNVTTFTVQSVQTGEMLREGVVHAHAVKYQETLAQVHPTLPAISQPLLAQLVVLPGARIQPLHFPPGVHLSQRNTPALFGATLIDAIPDRLIIANERRQRLKWGLAPSSGERAPVGRAVRLGDGRVGRFGWKGQTASLAEFVQAACANELGLGNPDHPQPRPLGKPDYEPAGLDLTLEQCNQLTAFIDSLPRPVERLPDALSGDQAEAGKKLFQGIGCADCHTPAVGRVQGLYSDLLLHRMGQPLEGGGSYDGPPPQAPQLSPGEGPLPDEWRTPPLWGVADSAPYLHDGRAASLEEAIKLHAGQGAGAAQRYARLSSDKRAQVIAFLRTLRAP